MKHTHFTKRRGLLIAGASLLAPTALLTAGHALAQDKWPSKPITYVVPFTPGGSTDVIGRLIAQKLGEEAVETVIAAMTQPDKIVSEAADLMFHLIVLLADTGHTLDDVRAELARREGVSGHDEKAARAR